MKRLTIHSVPDGVATRLEAMARARGQSVREVVLALVADAAALDERRMRLRRYATWSLEEAAELEVALAGQRTAELGFGRVAGLDWTLLR